MKINFKYFFGLLFVLFVQIASAQEIKVTGKVTDQAGMPIPGANVLVKGTKSSVETGFDGEFTLNAKKGDNLLVTFIGMRTVEVAASESMNVKMANSTNELETVLVVGYGTASKKKSTDATSRVTAKDIQQVPVSNVQNALVGKLAGVQVTQTNGKVEGGMSVRVRGAASISAGKEPLYVLDGIALITSNESSNGAPTNPLLTLSPNEIESIDVLKDASSAAIYGARGGNGVVLITTKKGKEGKGTFSINLSQGASTPTHKKKWLNSAQYVELFSEAAINGADGDGTGDILDAEDKFDKLNPDWRNGTVNTDWQDEAFQSGYNTDADFTASGGDAKTKYLMTGAYNNTAGIVFGNNLERLTGRINLSHKVLDKLNIGMNLGYSRSEIDRIQNDKEFTTPLQAVAQSPLSPTHLADGSVNENTLYTNFLLYEDNAFWKTIMRRLTGKIYGEYQIIPSLKFNSDFAYDLLSQTEDNWYGSKTDEGKSVNGQVFASSVNNENYVWSNYFTYDKTFADVHNVNVVMGMEYNNSHRRFESVTGINFPNDSFRTVDGAATISAGSGNETGYTFVSQFARANYSYANKYLLKASIRRDGSSRFGKNEQFGTFPAFSAGWIASEEDFLKDNSVVSFLKLKGSWGKVGNAEIGNFASLQLYDSNPYASDSGLAFGQAGNKNLTWEKSDQTDVGFEIGFLNRFNIEADYYNKKTDGLLFRVPLSLSSGASSINQNIGQIESSGFEFSLNAKIVDSDKLKWNTNFNITTNQTVVNSLPNNNSDIVNRFTINRTGENVSSFYLVEFAGVDSDNGDALFVKNTVNPDGTIDKSTTNDYSEAKRVITGNPFPELMAGLTNTMNFSGFDFSFTLQGEWGASIYNDGGRFQSASADYFDNQTTDQLNRWQKPGDITNVPQARLYGGNGTQASTRYLDKADFIRLRNLTFGYSLPKQVISKMGMTSIRFYLTGVNLLTFTDYGGFDPEARRDDRGIGEEFYSAPPAKTTALGVNINF
jgi:TonB-linked SusC/RagA family outer membrane protein